MFELTLSRANTTGEQTVDRNLLIHLAPDREELLLNDSLESIRDRLRITSKDEEDTGKWLSVRFEQKKELSTSNFQIKVSEITSAVAGAFSGSWVSLNKPSDLRLSSQQICVSPQPLGPTHTLVLYSDLPSPKGIYPKTVEMPIEALLFVLHCPNLKIPHGTPMPRRRQELMPRLLLRVRHLSSFPALVVYMHTRDHVELFRSILPRWIADALELLLLEKKTVTLDCLAKDLAERGSYDELVQAGSEICGLRVNIEDVGLREMLLEAKVELILRALINSINLKALCEFD